MESRINKKSFCLKLAALCLLSSCLISCRTTDKIRTDDANAEKKLKQLPSGKDVIAPGDLKAFSLSGLGVEKGYAKMQLVSVSGMPFKKAIRVNSTVKPAEAYGIQLNCPVNFKMQENDLLLLTFYGRALHSEDESGQGQAVVLFEKGAPPWTKSMFFGVGLERQWQKFYVPFRVSGNKKEKAYPSGGTQLAFNLGFKPQKIELADIRLLKLPNDLKMENLPYTKNTYEGSKPDAAWRKEANKRIEKIRKANLQIQVVDKAGKPVKNAIVKVDMTRHQFTFGTAINSWLVDRKTDESKRYLRAVKENFNQVVIESVMKWPNWPKHHKIVDYTVSWALKNGLTVRGHTIVWPSWKWTPWRKNLKEIKKLEGNPEKLRGLINQHIKNIVTAFKGQLADWDVVNEPYNNNDFMRVLGDKSMVEWYKLAQKYDSKPRLFINDFGILTNGSKLETKHMLHYEKTIRFLLKNGAPLQGIGMQGHFREVMTSPKKLLKIFDRFGKFNLPIVVTEFDHRTNNKETQAEYMRDFLTTAFSHPSVSGFLMWGLWDGCHWGNNAPIYNKDWSIKPGGKAYRDLVFKKWWTKLEGKTDNEGSFKARGFMGEYEITILKGSQTVKKKIKLSKNGSLIKIIIQ